MRPKSVLAIAFALAIVFAHTLTTNNGQADTPEVCSGSLEEAPGIARKDPPELGGCNSRCRRVYCAESGTGRTYLCRCDCPK